MLSILLSLSWVAESNGFCSRLTSSRFSWSFRDCSSTSAMKLFLALISVILSISSRIGGNTTKEFVEISTDCSWEQWISSLGRVETLFAERSRVVSCWKQKPNFGGIFVIRLPERLHFWISFFWWNGSWFCSSGWVSSVKQRWSIWMSLCHVCYHYLQKLSWGSRLHQELEWESKNSSRESLSLLHHCICEPL